MNKDWVNIFSTTQLFEAKVIEALLKDNEIPVFVMNKQDSAYGVLLPGRIDIYTLAEYVEKSKALIDAGLAELN